MCFNIVHDGAKNRTVVAATSSSTLENVLDVQGLNISPTTLSFSNKTLTMSGSASFGELVTADLDATIRRSGMAVAIEANVSESKVLNTIGGMIGDIDGSLANLLSGDDEPHNWKVAIEKNFTSSECAPQVAAPLKPMGASLRRLSSEKCLSC